MNKRIIVITGAGTGIGESCAKLLSSQDENVVLIGRRQELLENVAKETEGLVLVGDASNSQDWEQFIKKIKQKFGQINALISCAGGHGLGKATEISDEDWSKAGQLNLDTAFKSSRACLPLLKKTKGSIVLLGSIASLAAGEQVCGYTTFKHAIIGLTRSLARDYGPLGVRVNCVCPGWVKTPMADEEMQPLMKKYGETLEESYRRVTKEVPLGRPAEANEIAKICRFLISDDASIITGTNIVADGGSTIVDVPTLAFSRI